MDDDAVDGAFLVAADAQARQVRDAVDVQATYDAGIGFMQVCLVGMEATTAAGHLPPVPAALYQVWGALTDEMDAPDRGAPEQDEAAAGRMKQAAAEWLDVSRSRVQRAAYLERWVYEECGYQRPAP